MIKGGVPNSQMTSRAAGLRVQSSLYGETVPVVYGRTRVTPKLIWANDFHASKLKSNTKKGAGKKGLGGDTYTYSIACDFLLGHYPIRYVGWSWINKDVYALAWGYQEFVVSNGMVTINVPGGAANLIAVTAVVLKENYSTTFNDFGAPGPVSVSGTWSRPLWNNWFNLPNASQPGNALQPYVYRWGPGASTSVAVSAALNGQTVGVFFCYQNAQNKNPLPKFNLEFEPYLSSGSEFTGHPDQRIPYNWVSGIGSNRFDLGTSNMFPSMSFEVGGAFEAWGNGDCEPADIVTDIIMSGPLVAADYPYAGQSIQIGHGLNLNSYSQTSPLGDILGDLTPMRNYCRAYGISCALYMDSQKAAREWLQELLDVANCAPVWSGSRLKVIPYCEVSAAGNGAVYIAPTASGAVCDLDDKDFLPDMLVEVDRNRQADADNVMPIEHIDRSKQYNTTVTTELEQRSVVQFGTRKASTRQMHSIHDVAIAQRVASVLVKRSALQRNLYKFKLPARYSYLEAMDLVTITDPRIGLNQTPVRLTSVRENEDWTLDCEAEQFIYGMSQPTPMEYVTTSPYSVPSNVSAGHVNPPIIYEPPDSLAPGYSIWIGLSNANPNYGGCMIWISSDGVNYVPAGTLGGRSATGQLDTWYVAAQPDPDNTSTLYLDLTESLGMLASVSAADKDAFRSLCLVGTELISYQTATLREANKYNLTGLRRSCYGTPNVDHPVGEGFLLLDDNIFALPLGAEWVGKTIYLKFTTFNTQGGGLQGLDEVQQYTYVFQGRYNNFTQIVANDCMLDALIVPPPTANNEIFISYYGPGWHWSDITLYKADGTTRILGGGQFGPYGYTATHGANIEYSHDYWVMLNPASWEPYLLDAYRNVETAVYNGHICLGKVHTPDTSGAGGSGGSTPGDPPSGGGGGGYGGGGDDSGCPCVWMYFDGEISVAQTAPGLMLDCLDVYSGRQYREVVKRNREKQARSYLLVTENGAVFAGSWDTPFDLPDGRCTRCENMLGELVATDDGPGTAIVWSRVMQCVDIGPQDVMGIDLGGKTFACGLKGNKRVYSHNLRLMKPL